MEGTPALIPASLTDADAGREIRKAIGWTKAQLQILLGTVVPEGTSLPAVVAFAYVCKRTGLDPFSRQIYLINYGGKPTIVTGIDGYRLTAHRSRMFAGCEAPRHEGMVKEEVYRTRSERRGDGWVTVLTETLSIMRPTTTYVTVHKELTNNRLGKFVGVAEWSEFARYDTREVEVEGKVKRLRILRDTWIQQPRNMNAKCAEAQALRKMAPAELSGVYTDAELDVVIDVVGRPVDGTAPAALPGPAARPAAQMMGRGSVTTGRELWNRIMDHVGGNSEEALKWLARCSEFRQQDGKVVTARSWEKMSDGWAKKSWTRFQELTAAP